MATTDSLGQTLRTAIALPTDTMITLDLPLLLTRLSQLPATPGLDADHRPSEGPPIPPGQ